MNKNIVREGSNCFQKLPRLKHVAVTVSHVGGRRSFTVRCAVWNGK